MRGMKALIFLADGFETTEALATFDVLTRSHVISPVLVSIHTRDFVVSSMNVVLARLPRLDQINLDEFDMIILPGGKVGVDNLKASRLVGDAIKHFKDQGKPVHAICAAPSILAERGYLDDCDYTCFPGFACGKGNYREDEGVVVSNGTVTGKSMGYSIPFAEAIVSLYFGDAPVERLRQGTLGQ